MGSIIHYRQHCRLSPCVRRLLRSLLWLPALLASCGGVFQGPVLGSIELERPADAGDAVVFLRCRGPGLHGEVQTDAEHTRVGADGRFTFFGSITFPTTERCYLKVHHPRYRTARVKLADVLIQKLEPIALESWGAFFRTGPTYETNPGTYRPWPESEVRRHLLDTLMWLQTFRTRDQRRLARYLPDIHDIYRQALARLSPANRGVHKWLRLISRIEALTAYPYAYSDYIDAVRAGDAERVRVLLDGGVLRGPTSTLYLAATRGHLDVIDVLLANDEPVNVAGCGAPLLGAIGKSKWRAAVKLIRAGADADVVCDKRRVVGDALSGFARGSQLALLASFLDAGVAVDTRNSRNTTALAEAAAGGRIEAVKTLLAAGADPGVRTAEDVALIDDAVTKGYLDVERQLRLALASPQTVSSVAPGAGETLTLPWRRGFPAPYRVYSSRGQVTGMAADPEAAGVLWLATQGGLLRVAPETGEQRTWTRANGLPSSRVHDLWFEPAGRHLWLATSAGLARLPMDELDRVEAVGSGEPRPSHKSGFLRQGKHGAVWFWGTGRLYRLHAEHSEARRFVFPSTVLGAAVIPGSADFFLSDNSSVWRFDPDEGERVPVVDAKALAAHATDGPAGLPQPGSLALDAARGRLWIGSHRHGVFGLEIGTDTIRRPRLTPEQIARCAGIRTSPPVQGEVMLAAGQTFAQLGRCFGRIDGDNRFRVLGKRIKVGPVGDAQGDIWFLAEDGFYRLDAGGGTTRFARTPDPIANAQITALFRAGKRLLVGVQDAPLAVLDLEQRTWSTVAGVTDVHRLRRVAARDELLALGRSRYWWVDTETLAARELVLRPAAAAVRPGTQWQDVRDLEFDGQTFWALRHNRRHRKGRSHIGLHSLSADGSRHYSSAGGYSLGELTTLVQDPSHSGRLWLVRKRDRTLVDFDKATIASQLAGANNSKRRSSQLLAAALMDRRLRALTIKAHEALDPDAPDLTWGVQGSGLYLKRGSKVIHRWPAKLPAGTVEVVRDGETSVWIATAEGLLEFPIHEPLAALQRAP